MVKDAIDILYTKKTEVKMENYNMEKHKDHIKQLKMQTLILNKY